MRVNGPEEIDWSQVGIFDAITIVLERNNIDDHRLGGELTLAVYKELGLL